MIRSILNKTPYELFKGRKPNIMHLRIFGRRCYVHNNRKDALGKFDARSDETIFLGYSSHSKAYKVFNKRTLYIEESVHVLFDESNPLVENDAQDNDFELGFAKKHLLLTHEEGKNSQEGSGTEPISKEEGQGFKQIGGTTRKSCLEQDKDNIPETGVKTVLQTGARTSLETGARTAPKHGSLENQAREESVAMDSPAPRTWKHYRSHPLDQILSDLNSGVQTRSRLKNICAFYAFVSNIAPKNVNETLADSDWITVMQEELH